jgi:methyl-accepting chemotaxis protein
MRHAAKGMGDRAELSVEKALATQNLLASNKLNVDALIVNVGKNADASGESAKNVLELEERTRRIDKIVDAIVMVTVQTKMLAVNGNIEAARAGEYGRGFSVVAGDIRSLANESSENADRIKDLVKSVQTQITRVAGDIEQAVSKGRAEVERTKVSTTNLDRIAKESEVVVADIRDIARVSGEYAAGLQQAGIASQQIATAAEETSRASTEAASASEQALTAAQEIAQAIEEIASQADELQNG